MRYLIIEDGLHFVLQVALCFAVCTLFCSLHFCTAKQSGFEKKIYPSAWDIFYFLKSFFHFVLHFALLHCKIKWIWKKIIIHLLEIFLIFQNLFCTFFCVLHFCTAKQSGFEKEKGLSICWRYLWFVLHFVLRFALLHCKINRVWKNGFQGKFHWLSVHQNPIDFLGKISNWALIWLGNCLRNANWNA